MARLALGAGYLSSNESIPLGDLTISGLALNSNLALGGYIAPNLALHFTFWNGIAIDPNVTLGSSTGVAYNASLVASAFGVGATYFFVPVDFYVSASLGVSVLAVERTTRTTIITARTGLGWALNLALGKQFMVTPNVGLGIGGQLSFQSNPDDSYTIRTLQVGVLGVFTYH